MGLVDFINYIPTHFGLNEASSTIGTWLDKHPTVNKIVIIAIHIFRIVTMIALMSIMPFSPFVNFAIGLAASIFYRITVERFCPYRFALMSSLGAGAFELAKPGLLSIISGVAFHSLESFGFAFVSCIPLLLSSAAVIVISHAAVEEKYRNMQKGGSCCGDVKLVASFANESKCCNPRNASSRIIET